jgi:hypothetical protein
MTPRIASGHAEQGRQDSNLQPPVLETGALPVELRPSARRHCTGVRRRPLGALFLLLAVGFAAIGLFAARAGGTAWVIAVAAVALAVWMGESAFRMLR